MTRQELVVLVPGPSVPVIPLFVFCVREHLNSNPFHRERRPPGAALIQHLSNPQPLVPSRSWHLPWATSPHRHSFGVYRLLALGCYLARRSGCQFIPPNLVSGGDGIPGYCFPPLDSIVKFYTVDCIRTLINYRAILLRDFRAAV